MKSSPVTKSTTVPEALTVDFESTLRYVDIPVPDLPHGDNGVGGHIVTARSEVFDILDWLRKVKQVRGIYELHVRDSLYVPHSEEMIGNCLEDFGIEVLDWKRPDLSARPLLKHCPNLKKLTLYASGWAALQYWTSKEVQDELRDGMKNLREVEITIPQDLVGHKDSIEYETRAKRLFSSLHAPDDTNTRPSFIFTRKPWDLSPMDAGGQHSASGCTAPEITRLTAFLRAYETLQRSFKDPGWRADNEIFDPPSPSVTVPSTQVKVAVIDTGVDKGSIRCSRVSGASFVSSTSGESPWWLFHHPHGTWMAKIITDLDPCCQLLVAKVGNDTKDTTQQAVAEAFQWAIESGADIISLSISFETLHPVLEDAVNAAIKAGIVVIASTAGEGYNDVDKCYPADIRYVIRIAAATDTGKSTSESVSGRADFMFHGENIVVGSNFLGSSLDRAGNPWPSEVSGTSAATAVAAGVASLLIACQRLALAYEGGEVHWDRHMKRRLMYVTEMFEQIAKNEGKFARPWILFNEGSELNWGEPWKTLRWLHERFL